MKEIKQTIRKGLLGDSLIRGYEKIKTVVEQNHQDTKHLSQLHNKKEKLSLFENVKTTSGITFQKSIPIGTEHTLVFGTRNNNDIPIHVSGREVKNLLLLFPNKTVFPEFKIRDEKNVEKFVAEHTVLLQDAFNQIHEFNMKSKLLSLTSPEL